MQAYLKKHGPSFQGHSIKVDWKKNGQTITIEFQIQKRLGPAWQTNAEFGNDYSKNWGLWNTDVIEAFLQVRSHEADLAASYLEIQVSPLNQPFALVITEPRKSYFAPENLKFETQVNLEAKIWAGKMEVTLPADFKGDSLFGGFYACLGSETREFYALNPNPEANPDFHRPELFLNLDAHE